MWGEQNHEPHDYFTILAEEFGEVAREVCEWRFATSDGDLALRLNTMRGELVQLSAVAAAMIEAIDRRPR